jgi:hypothetical protein
VIFNTGLDSLDDGILMRLMEVRVRVRVAQPRRGFLLTLASSLIALGLFVWLHARAPFQGAKILGLMMAAGYAIAILSMLLRASRQPEERRGWILLSLGCLFSAAKTLLLTQAPGHRLPISVEELVSALLLTLGAALLTGYGILSWPGQRHGGTGRRDALLNGLGGVFLGASLWLLFWMGGTWHDGFQGHSVPGPGALAGGGCCALASHLPARHHRPVDPAPDPPAA